MKLSEYEDKLLSSSQKRKLLEYCQQIRTASVPSPVLDGEEWERLWGEIKAKTNLKDTARPIIIEAIQMFHLSAIGENDPLTVSSAKAINELQMLKIAAERLQHDISSLSNTARDAIVANGTDFHETDAYNINGYRRPALVLGDQMWLGTFNELLDVAICRLGTKLGDDTHLKRQRRHIRLFIQRIDNIIFNETGAHLVRKNFEEGSGKHGVNVSKVNANWWISQLFAMASGGKNDGKLRGAVEVILKNLDRARKAGNLKPGQNSPSQG